MEVSFLKEARHEHRQADRSASISDLAVKELQKAPHFTTSMIKNKLPLIFGTLSNC